MYVKIFSQILDSSVNRCWQTRHVFEDMLKLCDEEGFVDMTHDAIARRTNMPLEIVQRGIEELEKPDPHSRNTAECGRRIIRIDEHRSWGWQIVNYQHYRAITSELQKRELTRLRVARHRENKQSNIDALPSVTVTNGNGASVKCNAMQKEKEKKKQLEKQAVQRSSSELNSPNCSSVVSFPQKAAEEKKAMKDAVESGAVVLPENWKGAKKNVEEKKPKFDAPGFNPFALWVDANRELNRADPLPAGQALAAAKRIGKLLTDAKLLKRTFKRYLLDQDSFVVSNGHSLALLESRIEKYRNDPPMPTDERMMSCDQLAKLNPVCVQNAAFDDEWRAKNKVEFAKHPRYLPSKPGTLANGFYFEKLPGKIAGPEVPDLHVKILRGESFLLEVLKFRKIDPATQTVHAEADSKAAHANWEKYLS